MIVRVTVDRADVHLRCHPQARIGDVVEALGVGALWCGDERLPEEESASALAAGAALTTGPSPTTRPPPGAASGPASGPTPVRHAVDRRGHPDGWRAAVATRPPAGPTLRPPTLAPPPEPSPEVAGEAPLSWTAAAVPLAVGVGLAVFVDPRLAVFALLTPAMVLGQWGERRWRRRRDRRRLARDRVARQRFVTERASDLARDHARALERHEPPADLLAADPRPAGAWVWRRRLDTGSPVTVRVGRSARALVMTPDVVDAPTRDLVAAAATRDAPLLRDLGAGLAVVGPRPARRAVLRALVAQMSARYAPSELTIHVATAGPGGWDWATWAPQTAQVTAVEADASVARFTAGLRAAVPGRVVVVVGDGLDPARLHAIRRSVDRPERLVWLTGHGRRDDVPGSATDVVDLDGGAERAPGATLRDRATGASLRVVVDRLALDAAARIARRLAGVRDPAAEHGRPAARLLELHPPDALDPAAIRRRWAHASLRVTVGVAGDRPFAVDLRADGPHGLLAGTTGSGKSEALRTLLAGAALAAGPDRLCWILIDYKGGSAFADLAGLPHTVGLVTDLDEHLAARALRCLRAELRRRETLLRDLGAPDIDAAGDDAPPRLLVVVDEFAVLAAELPDFVASLVDVAQRGRSLGLHLLLATQRPGGAVTAAMQANLNLRVALRTQSEHDAIDVVGVPDPAGIDRRRPGEAVVRLGAGDLHHVQVATCSRRSLPHGGVEVLDRPLSARAAPSDGPHAADAGPRGADAGAEGADAGGPTDLARIVAAVRAAAAGMAPPERPWPPPLPPRVTVTRLLAERPAAAGDAVLLGLRDEPDRQRTSVAVWRPRAGRLALFGRPRGGATEALAAVGAQLLDASEPAHVHVVDAGRGLGRLRGARGVGAFVDAGDRPRLARLVRALRRELDRRRAHDAGAHAPLVAVLIGRFDALLDVLDDTEGWRLLRRLASLAVDGPPVGVTVALTASRPGGVPPELAAAAGPTLCLDLGTPHDHTLLGLDAPARPQPGRAREVGTGAEVQLVDWDPATWPRVRRRRPDPPPPRFEDLPARLRLTDVRGGPGQSAAGASAGGPLRLRFGLDDDRDAAELVLGPGDHALVVGPARSGRTTTLRTLAAAAAALDVRVCWDVELATADADGPTLALIDDVELLDDHGPLDRLLRARRPDLHVVAAGRVDVLRRTFAPWLRELARTRRGVALCPDPLTDGAVWECALPRVGAAGVAGRGLLLDGGDPRLVQVALVEEVAVA